MIGITARLATCVFIIARDPNAASYTDVSLSPPNEEDSSSLDLLTKTAGDGAAVAHFKKVATLTGGGGIARRKSA